MLPVDWTAPIRKDLCRLARFGANISDSYSCFIFLPEAISSLIADKRNDFGSGTRISEVSKKLEMLGGHSLSNAVIPNCKITCESGLIGWVAKHGRSIHVSPFEHDSRTLGVYSVDQLLKSFIGIPVNLDFLPPSARGSADGPLSGVIACDSKKTFAFSKLQGKLLEDLSSEVANTVKLMLQVVRHTAAESSWQDFISRAEEFSRTLGPHCVEVLRLRTTNLPQVETAVGTEQAMALFEQVCRLIQQSIPPHLPSFRLPQGELILVVDSMMTAFYENKIRAICAHSSLKSSAMSSGIASQNVGIQFAFTRCGQTTQTRKALFSGAMSIETLIRDSSQPPVIDLKDEVQEEVPNRYEYRRA